MKKYLFAIVAVATFGMSANAYYSWTDFDKTQVRYKLSGYATPEAAQSAAVASMQNLLNGVLPQARMTQSNRDECRDVNSSRSKKAIGDYIERRGQYSGVKAYGFSLSESFDVNGNPSYSADVKAQIPCLDKDA